MKSSVNATLVLNGLRVKVAMIKNSTVVCIQLKQSVSKCSLWQSKGTLREQLKCIVHYIKILSRLARNSFPPNWTRAVSPSQLVELVKARGWSGEGWKVAQRQLEGSLEGWAREGRSAKGEAQRRQGQTWKKHKVREENRKSLGKRDEGRASRPMETQRLEKEVGRVWAEDRGVRGV